MSHFSEDFVVDSKATVLDESDGLLRKYRNRSSVWQHFRKIGRSKAQCLLYSVRAKKLTETIARMMALDMQPYTIVEDAGFRSLLNNAEPRYQIPSSATFETNIIPRMYEDLKNDIRKKIHANLAEGELVFAFTADGWTSRSIESYLSLTVHYISKDFKMCHFMLNLTELTESHTAEHLETVLLTSLRTWELNSNSNTLNKPLFFVTDNGHNIVKAIDSQENWKRIPCYAHCLELAVKSAMKQSTEYTGLRKKCEELVGFFSRSTSITEKFLHIQSTDNPHEEPLELIQDVDTRWITMYAMLQRLIILQKPLTMTLCEEHMAENLNNDEWNLAETIVTVLQPLKDATEIMCGERYPTLSQYLPMYIGLINVLKPDKTQTKKAIEFSNYLCNALKVHFEPVIKDEIFVHAMLLDPRFKDLLLPPGEKRWEAVNSLKQKIINMANCFIAIDVDQYGNMPSTSTTRQYDEQPSKLKQFFNEALGSVETERIPSFHRRINEETQIYFSESAVPRNTEILEWWKCNSERLPIFAETARQYLGIPATQVSSKQLFSEAGNIVIATRTELITENVEQLCFLHANLR
ncbi:E3 SUMO-protein ligase ZBED1-like isoform X2 [Lasioglossum baleicum]|uniref:E3 SUMO-protein ligase ZBED1-like isoform X2 n=1 Tax=Lasioglossum baleicum TaxID=434251 RepID=UPI003FCE456F